MLSNVVDGIDELDMSGKDAKGDLDEYLLSKIASSGTSGQFRTPRYIIDMWSKYKNITQVLDALGSYPNEFWKYPVVIYYLSHRTKSDFENKFLLFLRKFLVVLLTRYLESPAINAARADIFKQNIEVIDSMVPKFDFKNVDYAKMDVKIKKPHKIIVRILLKIVAYTE